MLIRQFHNTYKTNNYCLLQKVSNNNLLKRNCVNKKYEDLLKRKLIFYILSKLDNNKPYDGLSEGEYEKIKQ